MAITFVQQKKRQQVLLLALGAILIITGLVLWLGFLKPSPTPFAPAASLPEKTITIDFGIFQHPAFEEFGKPREKAVIPENAGRENPFLPLQ